MSRRRPRDPSPSSSPPASRRATVGRRPRAWSPGKVAAALAAGAAALGAGSLVAAPSRETGRAARPGPAAEAALASEGRVLYREHCAGCHGPDGSGRIEPNRIRAVPDRALHFHRPAAVAPARREAALPFGSRGPETRRVARDTGAEFRNISLEELEATTPADGPPPRSAEARWARVLGVTPEELARLSPRARFEAERRASAASLARRPRAGVLGPAFSEGQRRRLVESLRAP